MSPSPTGLSSDEADRRLRQEGANDLPHAPRRTLSHIAADAAREPMFQLLVAGVAVYLLIGNPAEAALLMVFVAVTIGISVVQQQRTERVLEALRDLASPRALVLRDGQPARIAGREVVRGDLLVLSAGDRVAADAELLAGQALVVDESLLTGESVPVRKAVGCSPTHSDASAAQPGGEDQPWVWAGTLVVAGQGLARVTSTGPRSSLGRIGRSLAQTLTPPSPLFLQTRRLVRICAAAAGVISLGLVAAFVMRGDDVLASLLAGITLAMSLLPEEFTLILTVFMAMGAWRLSAAQVLSRRPAAIEALGAATVLCADKTGTMTLNRMTVAELSAGEAGRIDTWRSTPPGQPLTPATAAALRVALLASPATSADPMERALHALGREHLTLNGTPPGWALVHAWGLDSALLAMTHVWQAPGETDLTVASKGAPEAIVSLCRLDGAAATAWLAQAHAMAARGLRVIGVATGRAPEVADWPATPRTLRLAMVGLIGLNDPLRPGVTQAVRQCHEAGIRVAMVTGDHAHTAVAIAREAGLPTQAGVLTGAEIDALGDGPLAQRAAQVCVFARVMPAHKLRLVRALQSRGEVVAMTGDGVNDAPALKAAHIGIAMGARGTDVARESAALVLLDDDFSAIVQGLRLGRRILDNVRKAMAFVLAVHVPIAGLSLLPLLSGAPPLLTPVHIAFLELLIDPACSVVFEAEPEEPGLMRRRPRAPGAPLISRDLVSSGLLQGALTLAVAVSVYSVAVLLQWPPALERAAVFCTLVLGVLALIVANRSLRAPWWSLMREPNPALWWAVGTCLALLAVVMWVPAAGRLFGFVSLTGSGLLVAATAALALLVLLAGLQRLTG